MTDTLLPCPFCGSEPKLEYYAGGFSVNCQNPGCQATARYSGQREKTIASWNRRHYLATEQDARDAARWRAFLGSARIRLLGHAGFINSQNLGNYQNYRHFGAEFWTIYTADASCENTKAEAQRIITEYADAAALTQKETPK